MKKKFLSSILIGLLLVSGCSYQSTYQPIAAPTPPSFSAEPLAKPPRNFTAAKKEAWKIYADHRESFYCKCAFTLQGEILPATCPYSPNKVNSRTYKVEWEHIVPAKTFSGDRICWQKAICTRQDGTHYKGRACCAKVDKVFQVMEADLHNLVPAIGTINQARGTYAFGIVTENIEYFMGCPLKISKIEKKVEPRAAIKGQIARAYLYMSKRYGVSLPQKERDLYETWHHQYPPSEWEITWNNQIKKIQGNGNSYIKE